VTVRFGDCRLDVDALELERGGERVAVEPQVFDVLAYLVEHRDRVVPKTELLDEIWGDRFVSESALTSRIKSARRAVGDTGRDQRVIRTIHGRGFRFVSEVRTDEAVPPELAAPAPAGTRELVGLVTVRLAAGDGSALEVVGTSPAGLGQVVDDLYDATATAAHLVGRGSGAGAGLRPYGSVLDAVDELTQRSPGLVDRLPTGCRAELEAVLGGAPPSSRPRLFLAVRELLVAAAAERPTLLVVDELQFAHPDTLALLDHLARFVGGRALVLVGAHCGGPPLGARFERVELAGDEDHDQRAGHHADLPSELVELLRIVALEGPTFDLALIRAAAAIDGGDTERSGATTTATTATAAAAADRWLDLALTIGAVELVPGDGYRFAWPGLADELVAGLAPHRRMALHATVADRLAGTGADPARIAHHLLAAGRAAAAVPHAIEAARTADEARRYPDVLRWTSAVLDHASGADRRELLTRRASALVGAGDPTAVQVYREALRMAPAGEATDLRAGLARAAVLSGDLDTAREALAGLSEGDRTRPAVLLVRAMLAYFEGDLDGADALLDEARQGVLSSPAPDRLLDVVSLQGLIAHNRGEWFDRLRRELRATRDSPDLAVSIFDSHLCVAEYLLYGPTPYTEVIELAEALRRNAERSGARRAVAFAACVVGEARLLAGELEQARIDLEEAVRLHRELGADAGTAHSLQRLAEVELADGDPATATRLLREAVVLARWSPISQHLLQRIYGTLIQAADDREAAAAVVDEASVVLDEPGSCEICQVMVEVPATVACADVGRLDEAHRHLDRARWSAGFWEGTAWRAAVAAAEASVAAAEGRPGDAAACLDEAAVLFDLAGQPLDAERCREALDDLDVRA
jgi:DNA-binding winged helix-turn-helix (wHTH) protein/tetratricopeptide (TPR) repeat protein